MQKKVNIISIVATSLTILWICFLALTPIISRDALILHMAFPKEWMKESFFYFQDYNLSTVSMMNLDYVYMLLLKFFHWDQLPKIFHASMLLGSGVILYLFLKKKFGQNQAFIFSLIFVLIPINQRLASEAYVDLGVLFFSTIAIIYFIKWLESDLEKLNYIIISAIASGLSIGSKYSGAILPIVITLIIGFIYARSKKKNLKALNLMALYTLIIFVAISPWLIRNYAAVGNPFFPLLNSVFNPDVIRVESNLEVPPNEYATRKLFGESPFSIISIPFRMFFSGKDNDLFGGFGGVLNPMLLIMFIPLLFTRFRSRSSNERTIKYLSVIFLLILAFFLGYGHLRIRYFIYSIPLLIILNAYSFDILVKSKIISKSKIKNFILYSILTLFMFFNLKYSVSLYNKVDTFNYIFGDETKDEYLSKKLSGYSVAQRINDNSPKDAVIYEVLCGHRTYHIDRKVVFDDYMLDRYFYNMIDSGASSDKYLEHLSNLPFKGVNRAKYLMIKPHGFVINYKNIFTDTDSLVKIKVDKFNAFLQEQAPLYINSGTYIYELKYNDR